MKRPFLLTIGVWAAVAALALFEGLVEGFSFFTVFIVVVGLLVYGLMAK